MDPVNLEEKLALFSDHWKPRSVGQFNGHDLLLAKALGEFVWHKHDDTDDFFLVVKGTLVIEMRDRNVTLRPGELFVVPKGVEHRPVAREEVHALVIEREGTPNTGDAATATPPRTLEPTVTPPARIDRGDVFWVEPDDSRGSVPSYSHPHVVVQDDVLNHSRIATVVVCALTTNLHKANGPGNVLLEVGEGNLPKQSVVVVSQISSVDKARLGERIGSLSDTRVEQILAGLRFQQASFFRR